jgi:hypothetical protein
MVSPNMLLALHQAISLIDFAFNVQHSYSKVVLRPRIVSFQLLLTNLIYSSEAADTILELVIITCTCSETLPYRDGHMLVF